MVCSKVLTLATVYAVVSCALAVRDAEEVDIKEHEFSELDVAEADKQLQGGSWGGDSEVPDTCGIVRDKKVLCVAQPVDGYGYGGRMMPTNPCQRECSYGSYGCFCKRERQKCWSLADKGVKETDAVMYIYMHGKGTFKVLSRSGTWDTSAFWANSKVGKANQIQVPSDLDEPCNPAEAAAWMTAKGFW
uniref:Secreted protein n=1 Tax=Pfiesteria piscicida TaxID=71001 RepID=A3E3P8_PFIPI|nr:unknown [Pfiesteria piscicida]